MKIKNENRIGEKNITYEGYIIKIIEYFDSHNILVEFQDKYGSKRKTTYSYFKSGIIKNLYHKNVFGIGCIGETTSRENGTKKQSYVVWFNMIKRCYDSKSKYYYRYGGNGVKICEEWLCYANFEKWYTKNYYKSKEEKMVIDKDILIKGNKIYSPETCIICPNRINLLFIKSDIARGDCPIGVCKDIKKIKEKTYCYYVAKMSKNKNERKVLGTYNNEIDAFLKYKKEKEKYIKEVAEEYKELIPNKLYEAMLLWVVEEND